MNLICVPLDAEISVKSTVIWKNAKFYYSLHCLHAMRFRWRWINLLNTLYLYQVSIFAYFILFRKLLTHYAMLYTFILQQNIYEFFKYVRYFKHAVFSYLREEETSFLASLTAWRSFKHEFFLQFLWIHEIRKISFFYNLSLQISNFL